MSKTIKKATFKKTKDKKSINKIINDRLLQKPLIIQLPSAVEKTAKILKVTENGIAVHFNNIIPPSGPVILTGFIKNFYTEIEINVIKPIQGSLFFCTIHFLRISSQSRTESRFKITDPNEIYIKRIKISQSELDIKGNSIPVEYKRIMDKFMEEKSDIADIVRISTFNKKSRIHQEVANTGKTYYIDDSKKNDMFSIDINNDDLINLKEFYGVDLQVERNKMISKGVIGRIVSPIFAPQSSDMWVAIGYIDIISKTPFDFMKLMEVKTLSFEIVESLCEINQVEVDEKQEILDISKTGLRLLVTNEKLVNAMLHRPQFNFNIHIRGQAPISLTGVIRKKKKLNDGSLIIGVKIQGESGRQNQLVRYYEYIKSLEQQRKTAQR